MMASDLNEVGVINILSKDVFAHLGGWTWKAALLVLVVTYLYVHYCFASMTAHVTALYPVFFTAALAGGVPVMLAALALSFFSHLIDATTISAPGSVPLYFRPAYGSPCAWFHARLRRA